MYPEKKKRDKPLIVMCNGPSVRKVNLDELKDQDIFGMNGAYRLYKEKNWYPKYFGCFDLRVTCNHAKQFKELIEQSPIENLFFLRQLSTSPKLTYLPLDGSVGNFSTEFKTFKSAGNTGSNCCQVGMCLGYTKIILIGADCSYKQEVVDGAVNSGGGLVISKTPDSNPNYFFDSYQREGDEYNYPQANIYHAPAWERLAIFARHNNIDIVNCSEGSSLNCFRKSTIDVELGIPAARIK